MATPPNKPRDIKNLKARLGKAATPAVSAPPAASPFSAPPGASPFGSAPPASSPFGTPAAKPASGASVPAPGRASVPPAAVQPISAPGGIVAPPFARPQAQPTAKAKSTAPAGGASPFDRAAPVIAERKVTLVIDDSAVKEDEIGRKSRSRNYVLMGIGAALGLAFGFGIGATGSENRQYNLAVADGKDIYKRINEVSAELEQAKAKLKAIATASQGGPGRQATIDYKSIEALNAIKKPVVDNEFHGRRYKAFPQNVVNDLFDYYNNIGLLWGRINSLYNKTAGPNKRRVLDESAKAADEVLDFQYGMVLTKVEDNFFGGLVVVRPPDAASAAAAAAEKKDEKKEEDTGPKMLVSSREGGREVERSVFTGQEDVGEKYDNYVFLLDKARSMGILGAKASMFGEFRADLGATVVLMDSTVEIQGRLLQDLGKVAALKERMFLFF
jgi:hypothetical protein